MASVISCEWGAWSSHFEVKCGIVGLCTNPRYFKDIGGAPSESAELVIYRALWSYWGLERAVLGSIFYRKDLWAS